MYDVIYYCFFSDNLGLNNIIKYKLFLVFYLFFVYLVLYFWFFYLKSSRIFLTFIFFSSCIILLSENLIFTYLGLEFQGFSLLVLIGSNRNSLKNIESVLKYFILGAIFSGFYLLGLYLIYSSSLSVNISDIKLHNDIFEINVGVKLITLALLFKLGAAPFYYWLIDVYESVSWPVLGLLGSLPKISYLIVLYQLIYFNKYILVVSSIICIWVGVFGGFNQTKIKRLLGYSTLNHTGLLLLLLLLPNNDNLEIIILYYMIYTLNFLGFSILCTNTHQEKDFLINFINLKYINGIVGLGVIVLFLSLAGLPPLSGFFSKWFLILNLILSNYKVFSFMVILSSTLTIAYYLRLIKILYFQPKSDFNNWKFILIKEKNNLVVFWGLLSCFIYFSSLFVMNPNFFFIILSYYII